VMRCDGGTQLDIVRVVVWEWAADDQPTNVAKTSATLPYTADFTRRDILESSQASF
jgi:hypothetical protein